MRRRIAVAVVMMAWLGLGLVQLCMIRQMAFAAEMHDDPKGFQDIPWGTPLEGRQGFTLVAPGDRIRSYERTNAPPRLGDVAVDSMRFVTIDGKFARVVIRYRGKATHQQILAYLQSRFGPSDYRPDEMMRGLNQEHAWRGAETEIHLTYEDMGQRGSVFIDSRVLAPEFLEGVGGA